MKFTWWKSGEWNALCDVCGFKFKASTLKQRWDGLMCCASDWEPRHPQEMIRPIPDQNKLPWTRPDPQDMFVGPACTPTSCQGISGYGAAGCWIVGRDLGYRSQPTFI